MKVTRTSVHRLTIEKGCGCKATREYEDLRYTKPVAEGVFTACEKHEKMKQLAEFAGEMLLEALDKEAEIAGKAPVAVTRESTPTSLSGTSGESVQSMGAPVMPKTREKRDPLAPRTARYDRPDAHKPSNTNLTGALITADISDEELVEEGITITGDIDGVPQDPSVDKALSAGLSQMEDIFDAEDTKAGGVSTTLIERQAVD
jgi:hypothetical protein